MHSDENKMKAELLLDEVPAGKLNQRYLLIWLVKSMQFLLTRYIRGD